MALALTWFRLPLPTKPRKLPQFFCPPLFNQMAQWLDGFNGSALGFC